MTIYKFGDIVLVGSPHTDLQGISKRPAIVLYDSGDQDVLLARVTTQEYATETDYKILDWQKSGFLAESYIRLGKQATIEKRYIVKKLGTLAASEMDHLKTILRKNVSVVMSLLSGSLGSSIKKLAVSQCRIRNAPACGRQGVRSLRHSKRSIFFKLKTAWPIA